jgi:hypothetical protein
VRVVSSREGCRDGGAIPGAAGSSVGVDGREQGSCLLVSHGPVDGPAAQPGDLG